MPTIQRIVSGSDSHPSSMPFVTKGSRALRSEPGIPQTTNAATIWNVNFHWKETDRRSSTSPKDQHAGRGDGQDGPVPGAHVRGDRHVAGRDRGERRAPLRSLEYERDRPRAEWERRGSYGAPADRRPRRDESNPHDRWRDEPRRHAGDDRRSRTPISAHQTNSYPPGTTGYIRSNPVFAVRAARVRGPNALRL
mgnify:CR=1 FL=1